MGVMQFQGGVRVEEKSALPSLLQSGVHANGQHSTTNEAHVLVPAWHPSPSPVALPCCGPFSCTVMHPPPLPSLLLPIPHSQHPQQHASQGRKEGCQAKGREEGNQGPQEGQVPEAQEGWWEGQEGRSCPSCSPGVIGCGHQRHPRAKRCSSTPPFQHSHCMLQTALVWTVCPSLGLAVFPVVRRIA